MFIPVAVAESGEGEYMAGLRYPVLWNPARAGTSSSGSCVDSGPAPLAGVEPSPSINLKRTPPDTLWVINNLVTTLCECMPARRGQAMLLMRKDRS